MCWVVERESQVCAEQATISTTTKPAFVQIIIKQGYEMVNGHFDIIIIIITICKEHPRYQSESIGWVTPDARS